MANDRPQPREDALYGEDAVHRASLETLLSMAIVTMRKLRTRVLAMNDPAYDSLTEAIVQNSHAVQEELEDRFGL